uniref:DUF4258 domain-containing protein n=1 Tax=Streptomyces sp. NBC_01393 TaxID=2903851 RepID=A0AAU3I9W4_9ACTN
MTTIAEALGISWQNLPDEAPEYRLTYHAQQQALAKGWSAQEILEAANNPQHTYPSGRVPGQMRHIRGDIVTVIDPVARRIVTVYRDVAETRLRTDQTDRDARRYAGRTTLLGQQIPVEVDTIAY